MNLLTVGGFFLAEALQRLGHRVVQAETFLAPGAVEVDLQAVLDRLPAADRPDLLLVVEHLGPRRLPLHLEKIKLPRAFYALDPHLNLYWHQEYAAAFDLVFTTQRSSLAALAGPGRPAYWLPWAVDLSVIFDHGLARTDPIAFVGRVDPVQRRKRHLILGALRSRFAVRTAGETPETAVSRTELGRIYSRALLVVNESIQGEVNLRVFEAMAAGALLLMEEVGANLRGLFTPGEELITFGPGDLLEKAAYFLEHGVARRAVAQRGQTQVHRRHHTLARAREFLAYLGEAQWSASAADPLPLGQTLFHLVLRGLYPMKLGLSRAAAYLEAAVRREGSGKAYGFLSQVRLLAGDAAGALAALELACHRAPQDFHLHLLRGHLLHSQAQPAAALAAYRQGLEQSGQAATALGRELQALLTRGERGPEFYTVLGSLYQSQGLVYEAGYPPATDERFFTYAVEYYLKALQLDPRHVPALQSLGRLLLRQGLPCEAVPRLLQWAAAEPENPEARWLLGQAQLQSYQPEAGLKNLLWAQVLEPQRDLLAALREVHLSPAACQALLPQITPEVLCASRQIPC